MSRFSHRERFISTKTSSAKRIPSRRKVSEALCPIGEMPALRWVIILLVLWVSASISHAQYTNDWESTSNKTAYTSGNLTVNGITWQLVEALATTGDASDFKNGTRSARGRGYGVSEITMITDKSDGLGYVTFQHRRYGTDTQVAWVTEYSTNSGSSWTAIGSSFTPGASVVTFSNDVNVAGNVRIRIRTSVATGTSNRRANFDDIILSDYASLSPPSVTTSPGTATNTTTATIGGNVTADGGATVTNRGAVYKTTAGVTIADNKTQSGTGTGTFTVDLASLSVNQQYYYRAYAQNTEGTTLGSELQFWTWANTPSAPTVNNPTTTSLDINVNPNGNPATTVFSIQATNSSLYVQTNGTLGATEHWRTDADWGTTTVTGLSPSQQYGFRVRARNGEGTLTAWSTVANGTTSAGAAPPSVTTSAGTATNTTTATIGGNVTADGGASVTNRGVVYKTTASVTISDNKTQSGSGTGTFTANLTSLSVNQQYYFRAYAQNSAGTTLGSELQFWTWANVPSAPTVSGPTASSLNVDVNPNSNPAATIFSIQSTNNNLFVQTNGTLGATEHWRTDAAWSAITVTGLGPGSNYGFRVRAQNGQGTLTAWSAVGNGTTLANPPTVTTTTANPTNATTAVAGGNVTADGGATVTNRGVVWALSPATPTVPGAQTTNGTGMGSFSSTLTNLIPGATYNYRAFAQNSAGTAYGSTLALTTPCFSGVVGGLVASVTNDTNFTAAWNAFTGASGYALDVSTSATFGVVGGGTIYTNTWEGASKGSYASGTVAIAGITWWMDDALIGNLANDRKNGANSARVQNAGVIGMQSSTNMGLSSITFLYAKYGTDADTSGRVEYSTDGWSSWSTAGTFSVTSATLTPFEVTNLNVSGSVAIRIIKTSGGSARYNIDDIRLYPYGFTPSFVPGYSSRAVSATSQSVTGLTAGVTYYFRVRATNAYCVTDNSSTASVTTTAVDLDGPTPSVLLVNGASTLTDNTLPGGVALTVTLQDGNSGLATAPAPNFTLFYPDGATESGNFSTAYTPGVTTPVVVTNAAALDVMNWIPGTYTVLVSAVDMEGNVTTNEPFTFTLNDDDPDPPSILEFTVDGVGISGTEIPAGGIAIIGVNGNPLTGDGGGDGESFAFVVLNPFPVGTEIFFTDAGWSNNAAIGWHRTSEFHRASWVSTGSEALGSVVTLTISNINNGGDQVAVYQYDGVGDPKTDPANVRFLYAITLRNNWFDPPVPDNNESSALYFGLTNGLTALSLPSASSVNARYNGTRTGTAQQLLLAISNPTNWVVDPASTDITDYGGNFTVLGPGDLPWDVPLLTDAQVNQGGYFVTNIAQDIDSGLMASNAAFAHAPFFALFAADGSAVVSNAFPVNFTNGATAFQTMVQTAPPGFYEAITLGSYTAMVAVADADNDRNNDSLTARFVMPVTVVDDDTDPPVAGTDAVSIIMGATALGRTNTVDLLAGWNFNAAALTAVSHGSGAMINTLSSTNSGTGTAINAYPGDVGGSDLTVQGTANIGRSIRFDLNMSGRNNLQVSFAARRSDAGYDSNMVAFAVNGGAFTTITPNWAPTNVASTAFGRQFFDLSGYPEINGAALVSFQITFGTNNASASGTANNRFDNFQFSAGYITFYEISDAQLAAVSTLNPLRFSFNAFDAYSGLARGTANDGTNMMATIGGIATNNTANFMAGLSAADTTDPAATSVWEFTSFSYAQIGDLFANGLSNRPIRATMADADNDRPFDNAWASNVTFGLWRVIDDDTNTPEVVNLNYANAAARPFVVLTNGGTFHSSDTVRSLNRRTGTGSNTIWTLTDRDLAQSGTDGLQFAFGARDVHSGVARGNAGDTNTVKSFSLGDAITGNFANYDAALSSTVTGTNQPLTNIWSFGVGAFTPATIAALMADNIAANPLAATTRPVRITIPDTDNDRPNDAATLYAAQVGFIRIVDNDARGPLIANAIAEGTTGNTQGFLETFEAAQGWTNTTSFSGSWTNMVSNGTYIASGNILWGSLNPKVSGTRRIGLLTNVAVTTTWLQLPPVEDPGTFTVFAGRFGGEDPTNDVTVRLERLAGSTWTGLGDRFVSALNPEFEMLSWDVNQDGINTLRLVRVSTTGVQVYFDDINITPNPIWISTNQLTLRWTEAVDDYSNVDEYRVVAPALTNTIPSATNAGVRRATSITNDTFSILGQQGVITGFVFAIDDDNDRPGDRAIGNLKPIVVRIDTNPPPPVTALRATDAAAGSLFGDIDESSEIKIEWSPGGATAAQAAGWRQSDSEPLSPWDTYIVTYFEVADSNGTAAAGSVTNVLADTNPAWSNVLNNWAFTNLVLSNLVFDTYYRIEIRGRDQAGNIGLVTGVIGNTDRFMLTQAVVRADRDVELFWTGPASDDVSRDYDVIYVDSALGFRNSLSNQWEFMKYTNRPKAFDTGSVGRLRPRELTNGVYRFYRVARSERWLTNQPVRTASAEVYVSKAITLHPGENWYSLFSHPDSASTNGQEATVAQVFGTNLLPRAANFIDGATIISWFGNDADNTAFGSVVTASVWLGTSGWNWLVGGSGPANDKRVPLGQGFLIELPPSANSTSLVLVGRLPTQALVHVVSGSGASVTNPVYQVLSHQVPERISLVNLGITTNNGFRGGPNVGQSDEIRILSNTPTNGVGSGSLVAPKARIWWRTSDHTWRNAMSGNSPASNYIIEPDDAVVIVRRHTNNLVWTNRPTQYNPPTRNMSP